MGGKARRKRSRVSCPRAPSPAVAASTSGGTGNGRRSNKGTAAVKQRGQNPAGARRQRTRREVDEGPDEATASRAASSGGEVDCIGPSKHRRQQSKQGIRPRMSSSCLLPPPKRVWRGIRARLGLRPTTTTTGEPPHASRWSGIMGSGIQTTARRLTWLMIVQDWGGCRRRCAPASTATSTSCGRCSANNPPPASGTTTHHHHRRQGQEGLLLLGAGWRPTAARSDLMSPRLVPAPSTEHPAEPSCSAMLCSVDSDRQRAAVAAGQVLSEFSAYSRQLMMTIMILVHVHPLLI